MAGHRNPMRRAPVRLTPQNYKAYIHATKLQKGYRERIHKLKTKFLRPGKAASIPKPLHEFQPRMPVDLLKYFGIRVGDLVKVRFGPDRGKLGVVLEAFVNRNHVVVEGCNLRNRVTRVTGGGTSGKPSTMYVESPIHVTNVAPVDPVTKTVTRLKIRKMLTGEYVRLSARSGSAMPLPVPIATRRDDIAYYKRNILKKLSTIPQIHVDAISSKHNTRVTDVLSTLAANLRRREKFMVPHTLTRCRVTSSAFGPEAIYHRWLAMTKHTRHSEVPSKVPPVTVSLF